MLGQDDLLLGSLDGSDELGLVRLLELLAGLGVYFSIDLRLVHGFCDFTYHIAELCFGN